MDDELPPELLEDHSFIGEESTLRFLVHSKILRRSPGSAGVAVEV
jgi:hypothetical protein